MLLLQDWTTLSGDGTTPFVQSRFDWLDLARYGDVTLWLEVRALTNPGGGNVTLTYETSPATDDSLFQPMVTPLTLVAASAPVITKVRLADNPVTPLARYLRWKLVGTASGAWSVTFRVFVAAGNAATSAAGFDPATLSLTGWWRGSYTGSPWVGTASAGSSGSRDVSEATNPPSVGSAQNGFTPADFDGTNDQLVAALGCNSFFTDSAGGGWILAKANSAAADPGAGSRYDAPGLLVESGAGTTFGVNYSTAGVSIDAYDGASWVERAVAMSTGAYHLIFFRWNTSVLELGVDSGAMSSTAFTGIDTLAGGNALVLGRNYNSVAVFDGDILDAGTFNTFPSDTDRANVRTYVNARYALSL